MSKQKNVIWQKELCLKKVSFSKLSVSSKSPIGKIRKTRSSIQRSEKNRKRKGCEAKGNLKNTVNNWSQHRQ
jgi:hypothetical protein